MKKMTKIGIVVLSPFLLAAFLLLHQHKTDWTKKNRHVDISIDSADLVRDRLALVNEIDSFDNYRTVILSQGDYLEGYVDGGVELIGYYKDDGLVKITETIGLSYGVREHVYYLDKDEAPSIFREIESYFPYENETGSFKYDRTESGYQRDYYLWQGILIHTTATGTKRFSEGVSDLTVSHIYRNLQELVSALNKG